MVVMSNHYGKGKSPTKVLPSSGVAEEISVNRIVELKLRNITPTSVEKLSLSLTDFFSGETTPDAVKFKIKGGSKSVGQPGLMGASSSSAHENSLSIVVSQQGILMKSVVEMNKKLDILIESEQSQGGEENIDVDATIASVVKAVENLIGSSTHVPASVETSEKTDLEMVVFQETPILRPQKRDRKKGAVLKSPFIELASGASKSGSSSVSPDDSVYKVVKYVRGLCPLENKIGEPVDMQLEAEFVTWVDTGLRKHKSNTTTNVYCKGNDTIFPPFRFGVEDISNKMWFHNLAYPNCFLTNSITSFAEYFIIGKPIPSSGFDVEIHRDRLAVLFYHYGMKKQLENIESESEAPPSLPKNVLDKTKAFWFKNSNNDVASKVISLSEEGRRTVCILSANGAVCNATLRQPSMSGGNVSYEHKSVDI
ncbi:hypothetical protein F8388_026548 [Cannabis sativa]|uniref:AT-hook motif nuclear-localized protein n=1 Tax=Cannabis sativa TaxID=3483 RepID=A0A7J6E8H4_CANSA|nr:hypothetical protein F8388_026548 [Cannabis sativa]